MDATALECVPEFLSETQIGAARSQSRRRRRLRLLRVDTGRGDLGGNGDDRWLPVGTLQAQQHSHRGVVDRLVDLGSREAAITAALATYALDDRDGPPDQHADHKLQALVAVGDHASADDL